MAKPTASPTLAPVPSSPGEAEPKDGGTLLYPGAKLKDGTVGLVTVTVADVVLELPWKLEDIDP